MLEGGCKSAKNGLAIEVKIGGDAAKSGKKTHLLVIMRVRLSHKIGLLELIQKRKRLKNMYKKFSQLLGNTFNATYTVYIIQAHKC